MTTTTHTYTATDDVSALAVRARAAGRMALDVEFLWERTYAPIPCLAQVAVGDEIALIDPIEGASLQPIADVLGDPSVEIIMHAPSADLILFALGFNARPTNLLDSQLIGGFVGLGSGQSLGALLSRVLGVKVAKTEGYSDWSRRPLTDAQLEYAAADVAHLFAMVDELMKRATEMGRAEWVREEHERRFGPDARIAQDPWLAWRKVKGQGRLTPPERAALRRAAAWREEEARRRDRPVGWLIPDRTLIEVARRRPSTPAKLLAERGVPAALKEREAAGLIEAMEMSGEDAPITLGPPPPAAVQARLDTLVPLAQVLLGARAAAVDLAPTLVATRDDVESFLVAVLTGGDGSDEALGRGWRREVAGDALVDLASGRLGIAPLAESPFLREIRVSD
ncbi:MAG: HRDC domain-containing protein [Thermoleophilia bacterium]